MPRLGDKGSEQTILAVFANFSEMQTYWKASWLLGFLGEFGAGARLVRRLL